MRKYLLLALFLPAILASCQKDPDPVIEPEPTEEPPALITGFARSFYYQDTKLYASVSYPMGIIKAKAKLTASKSLQIDFDTNYPDGNDQLTLEIPATKLKSGYLGDYYFQAGTDAEVISNYQFKLSATSANKVLPGGSNGYLRISKYDPKFKTIEGFFEYNVVVNNDPAETNYKLRNTTVRVVGDFENLAVSN